MTTTAEMDEIFRQSVIDVIRRFSPEKKNIVVPAACLKELKEVVRSTVLRTPRSFIESAASHELRLPSSIARRGSNDSAEDEDSRMSCDSSEGCGDDDSRSSVIERIHKSSSSSSLPEFKSSHKKMSRAKRLQELRAHRRKNTEHEEFDKIDCNDTDFPDHFFDWYTSEIIKGGDVLYLYHRIINTINDFFSRVTFPSNVSRMVQLFLREHGVIEWSRLNSMYENEDRGNLDADRRILEIQLQVLMELYLIMLDQNLNKLYEVDYKEEPANLTDILRKLRYMYICTDATFLKSFLEEPIADNFNHIIPQDVANIFDKLCMNQPADLEEYDPNPNPWLIDDYNPCSRRLRAREETNKELQAMLEETSLSDSGAKENKEKKKVKEESSSTRQELSTPKRREKRQEKIIPETPDEKLVIKVEQYNEVVKQTPMGKLRQSSKRSCRKLSELIKLSEERSRPTRAAAIASEKANRAIMSAAIAPNTTKESLFALHTPSPRPQRSARTNLIDRFTNASTSTPTSLSSNSKRTRRIESVEEEPEKKRARRSSASLSSPPISPSSKSIPGLGREQILQYKKRMTDISKQKSPGAQTRTRTSLFEDTEVIFDKPDVEQRSVQKNRTGREVRASTTVHIAHILLNVHNPAPLVAFNAAKMRNGSAPRLQRLVRIAKKSQKIRLMRLRNRVRQSMVAVSATNADNVE